jgi:hypothetical protein
MEREKIIEEGYSNFKTTWSSVSDYFIKTKKNCEEVKKSQEKYLRAIPASEVSKIMMNSLLMFFSEKKCSNGII